jgi:hypothetical protein
MRTMIAIALVCAVVGLFGSLATHMLMMAGRGNLLPYLVTGPILTICHGVPPVLLSIVLLSRQESP